MHCSKLWSVGSHCNPIRNIPVTINFLLKYLHIYCLLTFNMNNFYIHSGCHLIRLQITFPSLGASNLDSVRDWVRDRPVVQKAEAASQNFSRAEGNRKAILVRTKSHQFVKQTSEKRKTWNL